MLTSTLLTVAVLAGSDTSGLLAPPPTPVMPVTEQMHGHAIVDNYRWLEAFERDSEEVRQWTDLQNAFTRAVLDDVPGRAALEQRLSELMQIGAVTSPVMRGNLYFYTERKGDENQAVLYVRLGHDGQPRELVNPNTLDERGLYSLDWFAPNHDGSLLAFGLSYAGDEMTVLHVLDVGSGQWLADEITGKIEMVGWLPDSSGFVYGVLEDPSDAYSRAYRVHKLGRHIRHNPMLIMQEQPSRIPDAMLSRDGRWLIEITFEGWASQELHIIDMARWERTGQLDRIPLAVGLNARFSPEQIVGDTLYMFTTLNAPNGMLYAVDLNSPARENWKVVIPERDDAVLRSVSLAQGILVANLQKNATTRLERFRMDGTSLGEIQLPGLGTASISARYDRTEAFISFTSYNEPTSIYRVDLLNDEQRELWARPDVPVDPAMVQVTQEWATSKDGVRVPMFIVHRKGLEMNGDHPTLLYGYGGFNISMTPYFIATNFPFYEQGGVYVVANLRGGGEFGQAWHRGGMLANKQNVFDDFYAVAEHLIERGYTNPGRLAILGGSNGGLLTGVAVTQRPDLFAAAISAVPLLDMLRYHQFLMARFWIPEYGSSEDPEQFQWLHAYSPYHNIEPGRAYPAVMFTAGENDARTHPLHARKMAAAMQTLAANDPQDRPILLWVDRDAGHGVGKPLHLRIRDVADRWAFVMRQTGMRYRAQ